MAWHWAPGEAAWRCRDCRRSGLEARRRCGWSEAALSGPERVVWDGGGISITICPKSLVSAQSLGWVEEFMTANRVGWRPLDGMNARTVEAFLILKREMERGGE